MGYSSIPPLYGKLLFFLMLAGAWHCKSPVKEENAGPGDTAMHQPEKSMGKPTALTLPDGTRVLMDPRTVIHPSEGFGKSNRDIPLDGEAMLIVRGNAGS